MRIRIGNPYHEGHEKALRVYEFVADGTKTPEQICAAAEAATGLRLQGDPAGQHGYINTRLNPDGSRFVAVVLYEACAGAGCPAGGPSGHPSHVRAADLTPAQIALVKAQAREHPQHRLTGNAQADAAKLRALGFKDEDPALRD